MTRCDPTSLTSCEATARAGCSVTTRPRRPRLSCAPALAPAHPRPRLVVLPSNRYRSLRRMRDLYFANGVALSASEEFVAVVETSQNRVMRYWLQGDKAGTADVLIDRLAGAPDGITRTADGHFWLSLVVPLSPLPNLIGMRSSIPMARTRDIIPPLMFAAHRLAVSQVVYHGSERCCRT
jgi:hypothetical protein